MGARFVALPGAAVAVLGLTAWVQPAVWVSALGVLALVGAVVAAVHHAERIAHRIGEPFGTLVLALAVTVIEVALIVSMMLAGGPDQAVLPRDTLYAAVMLICTGVLGLSLLLGGWRHGEQAFHLGGAGSGLAALVAMAGLTLVLPRFTTSSPGGTYTDAQLAFVAVSSLVLWALYVFVQTVRHRDYFLPPEGQAADEQAHALRPSAAQAGVSVGLLLVALVGVVGLAKRLSPDLEAGVAAINAPRAVVGILIAMIVLAPETWAALRAARANRLQTSLNLAFGSALASIGLTVPVVVLLALALDLPLELGLAPKELVLLALTFAVSTITLASGRTTLLQGAIHMVLFAAFLFLAVVP